MEEARYMISEASKRVEVEAHVLRYWQKELQIDIPRNEMDQRYYRDSEIELFKKVKHLKEQGFQLKAIKMMLPELSKADSLDSNTDFRQYIEQNGKVLTMLHEEDASVKAEGTSLVTEEVGHKIEEDTTSKMSQFKTIMNQIILNALKENNGILSGEISTNVTDSVIKEMSYLMRLQEEREEERFKKFDATLRDYQKSRMMAAAALEGKSKKKSKFFKKNNVHI